ncbi:hypothetical protein E1B28_004065 [Marasmius oreades]|uniref:Uncharacterized protein n=1 Tax=Marasmius oreades TaxID=181124 RepID=A0A9P7UXT8_9AGAR|nr:uncharacterized protein E1B28_004065 [Marasmius oreades]KAG7096649.1 hypothetical protein E1B28_004065 [Marasmius oreades]
MILLRRPRSPRSGIPLFKFARCYAHHTVKAETDALGMPLRPTWSIKELLSSYPKPTLASSTLTRIHELSALIPPGEGTKDHEKLKQELEELVRLVEAVKLVNTEGVVFQHWGPELGNGAEPDLEVGVTSSDVPCGSQLLVHAQKTVDGFYVVDADRRR